MDSALMDQILANRHLTMASEGDTPPEAGNTFKNLLEPRVTAVEEEVEGEPLLREVEVESEVDVDEMRSPKPRSRSAGTLDEGHYKVPTVRSMYVCVSACVWLLNRGHHCHVCRCRGGGNRHTITCQFWIPGTIMSTFKVGANTSLQ